MHPRTQAPLLVIVLSRPELLERRPNWGGGRQNFIMLTLEPLSEVQTQELVGKLMTELPPTMRKARCGAFGWQSLLRHRVDSSPGRTRYYWQG